MILKISMLCINNRYSLAHEQLVKELHEVSMPSCTGSSKRKGAKFGEGSSIRADWQCIGCLKLVGRGKAANSNRGHFFCTCLYSILESFEDREQPLNGNPVKRCITGRSNGNGNGR